MKLRLLQAALFLAAGCAHPGPVDDLYARLPTGASQGAGSEVAKAAKSPSCQNDWECGDGFLCLSHQCTAITPTLAECANGRVHFDFDQSSLHPDEAPVLQRMARCLKADRSMHIRIDGNTDERGTLEYNLALGDQRARVVADYLKNLGVSDKQMATVTYGKDNPLCNEHSESCWSQNRRAGIVASR